MKNILFTPSAPRIDQSIGFTGTHHGMTFRQRNTVWIHLLRCRTEGYKWFHHGDCVGADEEAAMMAFELGFLLAQHPPRKESARAFTFYHYQYPEAEYLERNRSIVHHSEQVIATPFQPLEQPRGGTWYTVRYARRIFKPVHVVHPRSNYEILANENLVLALTDDVSSVSAGQNTSRSGAKLPPKRRTVLRQSMPL